MGHVCTDNILEITRLRARDHLVESDAGAAPRNRSEHEPPKVKQNKGDPDGLDGATPPTKDF